MSGAPTPTYEHDDPLPEGDGVLLPESSLPEVVLGATVSLVHTPSGKTAAGVVVAFEERDGERWVAVRYR